MPTLTDNGETSWIPAKGPCHIHLSGNFGGGTAVIQFKDTSGVARSLANGSFTSAVDKLVSTGFNTDLRISLSGATGPALVYDIITSVP